MTVGAVAAPVACNLSSAAEVVAAVASTDVALAVAAALAQIICILLTAVELKLHPCWLCIVRGTLVVMVVAVVVVVEVVVEVVTLSLVTMLSSCQRFVVRCSRGEASS